MHHLDGLAGGFGALQRDVDQVAVVHDTRGVEQLVKTSEGGLPDGQLVFVHIADHRIGMFRLLDLSEFLAGVPFVNIHHGAFGIVGGGTVVEFAVEHVRVGGVANHRGTVFAGSFGDEKVGAGFHTAGHGQQECRRGEGEFSEKLFHIGIMFIILRTDVKGTKNEGRSQIYLNENYRTAQKEVSSQA